MSEMVERVARALCRDAGNDPDQKYIGLDNEPMVGWRLHEREARAAIAAMREPTEAMHFAGIAAFQKPENRHGAVLDEVWSAMIDDALK